MGILQVVSEGQLQAQEAAQLDEEARIRGEAQPSEEEVGLAGYVRGTWRDYRNARTEINLDTRISNALRSYNGRYSPEKLAKIRQFGGSEVYSRIVTVKCRGTTAMLRDVFLSSEQPWGLAPTPIPDIPTPIMDGIEQLVQTELQQMAVMGMPEPSPAQIEQRVAQLSQEAYRKTVDRAEGEARKAEQYLQDILIEGKFYEAMAEFLIDLPIYPYAVMKGPVVQMCESLKWHSNGSMEVVRLSRRSE